MAVKAVGAKKGKKEKKHVVHGIAHVHASFNNTHVTITDLEGDSDRGEEVIEGLLRAMTRPQLEALHVEPSLETAEVVFDLVGSPHLGRLRELSLWLPEEHDEAVAALAASPHLGRLRKLVLSSHADFGDPSLNTILDSPHLANLADLRLDDAELGAAAQKRYRARFGGG